MKDYECYPSQMVGDSRIFEVSFWMTEKDLDALWELANRRMSCVGSTTEQISRIIRSELKRRKLFHECTKDEEKTIWYDRKYQKMCYYKDIHSEEDKFFWFNRYKNAFDSA